jgi:threonine aldolase
MSTATERTFLNSDNTAAACPEVIAALQTANVPCGAAYDDDAWSQRLDAVFSSFFATPVRVFTTTTGTAANSLGLAALCPPYGAVLCHHQSHINNDECGAPEFFSGGAKLLACAGADGKLTVPEVEAVLATRRPGVHQSPPCVLSITQATECGTVYTPDELRALTLFARERGLRIHMDGARLANAIVHLGCHPGDVTWRTGVEVLSFGAVKNGGLSADALVVFDPQLAQEIALRRKRAGQLASKGRFQAAQLLAYVESGAWERNARRANEAAETAARAFGSLLLHPVEANIIFARLGKLATTLRAAGFDFHQWPSGAARLVFSWDTPRESVARLVRCIQDSPVH